MLDCVSVSITTDEDCWIVVETFGFSFEIWSASAVTENVEKIVQCNMIVVKQRTDGSVYLSI